MRIQAGSARYDATREQAPVRRLPLEASDQIAVLRGQIAMSRPLRERVGAFIAATLALVSCTAEPTLAAVKKVPYPEVRVEVVKAYEPDSDFREFRKAFEAAVDTRDGKALFSLVGPTFVWTIQGQLAEDFDPGRDAIHNFKVVFGFREHGSSTDDAPKNGPHWNALKAFVTDPSFYKASETTSLTCGPLIAQAANAYVFEAAQKSIAVDSDYGDWYFTAASTTVFRSPTDPTPIGVLDKVAFPVLKTLKSGNAASDDRLEVLLPSGTVGWIDASEARPMITDQLCYAKTENGGWKIVNFDEGDD